MVYATTCFPNLGACPPPYNLPDDEPEERSSRLDDLNPESLRAAKLGLIGAMAAETPRQFTTVLLSTLAPFAVLALGESTADLIRGFKSDGVLEALVELADKNGIKGAPLDSLKALLAEKKSQRSTVYPAGPLPCCHPPQIDPDGTLILPLEQSQRQLADRDEVRVRLRGVNFADVKVTKSDAGYFVEAPSPTITVGGPKAMFRGPIHSRYLFGPIGLGAPEKLADAVVSWDAATEELVLAFMRAGVTEVKVDWPEMEKAEAMFRSTTVESIVELAKSGLTFEIPGSALVVGSADPAELAAHLTALPIATLLVVLSNAHAARTERDGRRNTSWEAPAAPPVTPPTP